MRSREIRVRAKTDRFSFDGQTGCLVLAGVLGTVSELTLDGKPGDDPKPRLRVFWDSTLLQDRSNKDPDVADSWEEDRIDPATVAYVETREVPDLAGEEPQS